MFLRLKLPHRKVKNDSKGRKALTQRGVDTFIQSHVVFTFSYNSTYWVWRLSCDAEMYLFQTEPVTDLLPKVMQMMFVSSTSSRWIIRRMFVKTCLFTLLCFCHAEMFCMGFSFAAFFFYVLITRTTGLNYDSEFFSTFATLSVEFNLIVSILSCVSCVSLQSVWPCRQWSAWWAGSSWWWAGGVSVRSWPASSWSGWCSASSSPPPSSSLLSVGKKCCLSQ